MVPGPEPPPPPGDCRGPAADPSPYQAQLGLAAPSGGKADEGGRLEVANADVALLDVSQEGYVARGAMEEAKKEAQKTIAADKLVILDVPAGHPTAVLRGGEDLSDLEKDAIDVAKTPTAERAAKGNAVQGDTWADDDKPTDQPELRTKATEESRANQERVRRLDEALAQAPLPHRRALGSMQPFDPPEDAGLSLTAEVDRRTVEKPGRVILQAPLPCRRPDPGTLPVRPWRPSSTSASAPHATSARASSASAAHLAPARAHGRPTPGATLRGRAPTGVARRSIWLARARGGTEGARRVGHRGCRHMRGVWAMPGGRHKGAERSAPPPARVPRPGATESPGGTEPVAAPAGEVAAVRTAGAPRPGRGAPAARWASRRRRRPA